MPSPPYMTSRSPPPLQHPKPTHPAYPPPEPPHTPAASTNSSPYSQAQRVSQDGGYVRYSSPPVGEPSTASSSGVDAYSAAPTAPSAHARAGYPTGLHPHPPAVGYQGMGNMSNGPQFGGWSGMNDATAQMGVQFGKSAVAAGQEYVEKNVRRLFVPTVDTDTTTDAWYSSPDTSRCSSSRSLFRSQTLTC